MPRYKIIVNPTSGRGMGEQSYPIIDHEMKKLGLDYEMCRTEAPGHAIQLAKQAAGDGFDVVVAAGGRGRGPAGAGDLVSHLAGPLHALRLRRRLDGRPLLASGCVGGLRRRSPLDGQLPLRLDRRARQRSLGHRRLAPHL